METIIINEGNSGSIIRNNINISALKPFLVTNTEGLFCKIENHKKIHEIQ